MAAREAVDAQRRQCPRPGMGVVAPFGAGRPASFSVVPDERTNSLIVLAGPLQMRQIKDLVSKLDIRSPNETSRIHVYHLKIRAGARDGPGAQRPAQRRRRPLLRSRPPPAAIRSAAAARWAIMGGSAASAAASAAWAAAVSGGYGGCSFGGGSGSGFGGSGWRHGRYRRRQAAADGGMLGGNSSGSRRLRHRPAPAAARAPTFANPVNITADPATNSLVVSAAPQDYETLQAGHRSARYSARAGLRAGDHRRGQRRTQHQGYRRQLPGCNRHRQYVWPRLAQFWQPAERAG